MEVVDVGSMPAETVISGLLDGDNLRTLAGGHGTACFALPGIVHSRAFYEALIEHSGDIDATTRQHVAFLVFYGNRSGLLRRVEGYRPHLERYRLDGLSTSTDAQIEVPEFSSGLGDRLRFQPHRIHRPSFHHSMGDCARAILDRFAISHSVEPCLLFVDPEQPTSYCIVPLDGKDPVRSLLSDVLTPMSAAFRELSAYWGSRDQLRWRKRDVREAQAIADSMPNEIIRLTASVEQAESERSAQQGVDEREIALLSGLLRAFEGDWKDADLRLPVLFGSELLEEDLKALEASRRCCADIAQKLASLADVPVNHREMDERNKLMKTLSRSENKRRARLGQVRKRLSDKIERIGRLRQDRDRRISSLRDELSRAQARLKRASDLVAATDPTRDAAEIASLAEREAKLCREGYSDEVLSSDRPKAFAVVQALHRTGRIGVRGGRAQGRDEKVRILFLASNPQTTTRLDLEEELRSLEAELRGVRFRDEIALTDTTISSAS